MLESPGPTRGNRDDGPEGPLSKWQLEVLFWSLALLTIAVLAAGVVWIWKAVL